MEASKPRRLWRRLAAIVTGVSVVIAAIASAVTLAGKIGAVPSDADQREAILREVAGAGKYVAFSWEGRLRADGVRSYVIVLRTSKWTRPVTPDELRIYDLVDRRWTQHLDLAPVRATVGGRSPRGSVLLTLRGAVPLTGDGRHAVVGAFDTAGADGDGAYPIVVRPLEGAPGDYEIVPLIRAPPVDLPPLVGSRIASRPGDVEGIDRSRDARRWLRTRVRRENAFEAAGYVRALELLDGDSHRLLRGFGANEYDVFPGRNEATVLAAYGVRSSLEERTRYDMRRRPAPAREGLVVVTIDDIRYMSRLALRGWRIAAGPHVHLRECVIYASYLGRRAYVVRSGPSSPRELDRYRRGFDRHADCDR